MSYIEELYITLSYMYINTGMVYKHDEFKINNIWVINDSLMTGSWQYAKQQQM